MIDRRLLEHFYTEKTRIKLNLNNGRFYTGIIIELSESSLLFEDKFGSKIPFSLDVISYIDIDRGNRGS